MSLRSHPLVDLFLTFARIGGMTFGGGYAMLPILQREIVETRGWATGEELTDYFAVGQCTPGIIAVNTATFVGQKRAGIPGGIAASLGMVFPSMVIITVVAALLGNFAESPVVQAAFGGIRVCVCVLILNAVTKLWKNAVVDLPCLGIFVAVAVLSLCTSLSPVVYVLCAALAGVVVKHCGAAGGKAK